MKAPITTAQAMSHPDVVLTINTLGKMADELRTQNTALLSDKEVLLSHMDTFMRVSNDPAIYNLAKVVTERFAEGKDV